MLSLWRDATTGIHVVRLTRRGEIETLVGLFEGVAQEENWHPGDALRQSGNDSIYFALKAEQRIIGGLQLTLPNQQGTLPCFRLWPEAAPLRGGTRAKRSAHVGILALDAQYRGQSLFFWKLAIEMWRWCVGEGIATLFIEVTPRVLPLYRRLGWPLVIQGDKKVHWGEECYLCTLGIAEVAQSLLLRAEDSPYYRQIVAQAFRVMCTVVRQSPRTATPTSVREAAAAYAI